MSLLHEKYENMISEYLDGELSEAEEKELILHLEGCPDCAEHLAFVKKLSENLSIAPEEPSPDFTERLMNRLAFESFEEEKKEENKPIRLFNKKSFALAACLALVIITALFAVPRLGGGAKLAAPQMAAEEAANENKDEMKAFDYAADSEAGSGDTMTEFGSTAPGAEKSAEESGFGQSLISALSNISAENPVFELYDSDANMIYESTAGAELIYALLAEVYEYEKKEVFEPDYELIFTSEGSELRLKIYNEDKAFYVYAEDFDKTLHVDRNFSELMRGLFGLSLGS